MANLNIIKLAPDSWHTVKNGRLYWSPNFIASNEADELFELLRNQIEWREDKITLFGKTMPIPRLQCWYGDSPYKYSNITMQPEPWLPHLLELKQRCESVANSRFNSVLANLYRNGQDSNGWHSDNEPELGTNPVIASLSFGETRRFHLKHKITKEKITFDLASGSLLIMTGEMQKFWLHTLPKTKVNTGARLNLTFRNLLS